MTGSPTSRRAWRSRAKPSSRPVTSLWTYDWWPVSQTMASRGESKTRCRASVSSTDAEVGAEVAAAHGDGVDQHVTDLGCKLLQLDSIEML